MQAAILARDINDEDQAWGEDSCTCLATLHYPLLIGRSCYEYDKQMQESMLQGL